MISNRENVCHVVIIVARLTVLAKVRTGCAIRSDANPLLDPTVRIVSREAAERTAVENMA